ncbi:MAG: YhjD/YihY/BrkB family envelope integrity protein [Acutalibacteraceae bacterium]
MVCRVAGGAGDLFHALYKFLPARKTKLLYEFWRDAGGDRLDRLSFLYSLYVDRAASNTFYGSLTTVVFLMLWLYACMYIVFFGAEVNALLFNNKLFEKYKEEKAKRARKDKDQ